MILRRRRHAGDEDDILHLIALGIGFEAEIHDRRDQQHAVEADIIVAAFEFVDDRRRARGAIAFTAEEFRRVPAAVFGQPQPDEGGDRFGIGGDAPEDFRIGLAERVRKAGADGIDEYQIGDIEQRFGIVGDRIGRRAVILGIGNVDALRPERPHVQPQRARAGAAVEQEGDRPVGLGIVLQIGRREDRGVGLAVLVLQVRFTGDGGVGDGAAAEIALVLRHGAHRGGDRFIGGGGGRGLGLVGLLPGERQAGKQQGRGKSGAGGADHHGGDSSAARRRGKPQAPTSVFSTAVM